MKFTKEELKQMSYSEDFIHLVENISTEDGCHYQVIRSVAPKSLYENNDDEGYQGHLVLHEALDAIAEECGGRPHLYQVLLLLVCCRPEISKVLLYREWFLSV